jgi:hypothetical protein
MCCAAVTRVIRSLRAGAQVRGDHLQGPPGLAKRNHAILVRRFVTIDGQAWEEGEEPGEDAFDAVLRRRRLPTVSAPSSGPQVAR